MKKIVLLSLCVLILSSCWSKSEEILKNEKVDFFVETQLWSDFLWNSVLKKTWQIRSSQDITLTANAVGRVAWVYVKAGDNVQSWQVIAILEDNIGSYEINLQRALNWLERAKINYDSTEISLDKQIFDADLSLKKLERNLETLRNAEQDSFVSGGYEWLDSTSALRIQQLDNNIKKAKLDYEIKLLADAQTLIGHKANTKKEFNALTILLDDVLEFSDSLLGVTIENKRKNDDFEDYLWASNKTQKSQSELSLLELIWYKQSDAYIQANILIQDDISEEEMLEIIDVISQWYEGIKKILNNIEQTLNNSTPSLGALSETDISWYIASVNVYQSQLQWGYGVFVSTSTAISSFLQTYKDSQISILTAIQLQEKDREIQLKNTQDGIEDLQSQVDMARNNLKNSQKTKDITLKSLQNAISEAQISYASAQKEYNKLTITSPINGSVSDVFIDAWQEVFSWTSLFKIVSNSTPEVEVSFSSNEKVLVDVSQKVFLEVNGKTMTGSIYAISEVADTNLNYKASIIFPAAENIIWNLVEVQIPIETDKMLVPINIITTKWDEIWTIKTLSWSNFNDVRVRLWEVFNEQIEIISCAQNCEDLRIIMSDVSNFDENKFIIREK